METTVTKPSRQTRTTVWLTFLLLAAIAWVIIFQQTQMIESVNEGMAAMEAGPVSLLLFLPLWVTMYGGDDVPGSSAGCITIRHHQHETPCCESTGSTDVDFSHWVSVCLEFVWYWGILALARCTCHRHDGSRPTYG